MHAQTVRVSKFFQLEGPPSRKRKSGGDNLPTLQLCYVLSQHFSGKLSSFLSILSNIIPSLSKQLCSAVLSLSVSFSHCSRGADTQRGCRWAVRQNRQNEEERGGMGWGGGGGHQGLWLSAKGEGSPRRSEGSGEKKERGKDWKKREQVSGGIVGKRVEKMR